MRTERHEISWEFSLDSEPSLYTNLNINTNDEEINDIRKNNPGIKVIAHPECPYLYLI